MAAAEPAGSSVEEPETARPADQLHSRADEPAPARLADRGHAGVEEPETARLADQLHSAAIHLLRRLRRTDPLTGVSAAQLSALSVLMGGPRTLGELAAIEQVRPPTMSRLVRELEAAGLVSRSRDDRDARVVWVRWTAEGERLLRQGRELRVAALRRQIEALSEAERRLLTDALALVERVLERL